MKRLICRHHWDILKQSDAGSVQGSYIEPINLIVHLYVELGKL